MTTVFHIRRGLINFCRPVLASSGSCIGPRLDGIKGDLNLQALVSLGLVLHMLGLMVLIKCCLGSFLCCQLVAAVKLLAGK